MRRLLALTVALVSLFGATWQAASVELIGTSRVDRRGPERAAAPTTEGPFVIGAAGEIACAQDPNGNDAPSTCQFDDTSDLVVGVGLDEVLLLGDNQYEMGEHTDYRAYFDPT